MHEGKCKCFHHVFKKILMILGLASAILFLVSSWGKMLIWGMDPGMYFMHFIVFTLMAWSTKSCKCCCDEGCGKNCGGGVCMPKQGGMGGGHQMGQM